MADFKIGDVVAVDDPKFPGPWTVAKVNKATYTLSSADPRFARGLRARHQPQPVPVAPDQCAVG